MPAHADQYPLPGGGIYGDWPKSGEIDVFEIRGNEQLVCGENELGRSRSGSTLHWGMDQSTNRWPMTHADHVTKKGQNDHATSYHKYVLEWKKSGVRFLVDDEVLLDRPVPENGFFDLGKFPEKYHNIWENGTKMAPFDQEFYLIINISIGGFFFPDDCDNIWGEKPWKAREIAEGTAARSFFFGGSENSPNSRKDFMRSWTDPTLRVKEVKIFQYEQNQ